MEVLPVMLLVQMHKLILHNGRPMRCMSKVVVTDGLREGHNCSGLGSQSLQSCTHIRHGKTSLGGQADITHLWIACLTMPDSQLWCA